MVGHSWLSPWLEIEPRCNETARSSKLLVSPHNNGITHLDNISSIVYKHSEALALNFLVRLVFFLGFVFYDVKHALLIIVFHDVFIHFTMWRHDKLFIKSDVLRQWWIYVIRWMAPNVAEQNKRVLIKISELIKDEKTPSKLKIASLKCACDMVTLNMTIMKIQIDARSKHSKCYVVMTSQLQQSSLFSNLWPFRDE